ncbi:MAG: hypothetical protein SFW07_06855 [Gammaproteobacteria bacterium]|nr:hypothetical protein [Gammaproteobacteria bacterium]
MNNALKISGPDAEKFLQGQVTCNVQTLVDNQPQLCALCNRKGRVIASFNLIKINHEYFMMLDEAMIEIVEKVLSKYARFSKVTLLSCHSERSEESPKIEIVTPETSEQFTPHKLNYHLIPGMIDFNKGCYTGQEIIARVHYRGKKA